MHTAFFISTLQFVIVQTSITSWSNIDIPPKKIQSRISLSTARKKKRNKNDHKIRSTIITERQRHLFDVYIIINVDIPVRVINHCSQAYSKQGKNLLLVENRWPRTEEGGAYILFISVISIIVERGVYTVFSRVWIREWNWMELRKEEIYLPSTLRSPRENQFSRETMFGVISFLKYQCAWVGWWIVWNEMVVVFIRRVHRRSGRFFLVILCMYWEERTIVSSLT